MPHIARINKDNIVEQVIVVLEEYRMKDGRVLTPEQWASEKLGGTWIRTSYNTRGGKHYDPVTNQEDGREPLRKNYAGIGYTYDKDRDAFIPPKPEIEGKTFELDEETCLWKLIPDDKVSENG